MITVRSAAIVALILVLGLSSACRNTRSPEQLLRPEEEIPELRALGKAARLLPYRPVTVESDATADAGLRVAVHEYGKEQQERVLVLIHGVLTDHRVWTYVIGALDGNPEVWAIDLPGCGNSDKPNPKEAKSPDAYSPTWMAKHVELPVETKP